MKKLLKAGVGARAGGQNPPNQGVIPAELREMFDCDADTGRLYRKVIDEGELKRVAVVTTPNAQGYLTVVMKKRRRLFQHRVIWCLVHGYFPEHDIDHINRCREDNRLENLRAVSRTCNQRNSRLRVDNRSGVRGVSERVRVGGRVTRWVSWLYEGRRKHHLGTYDNFTEAVAHRLAAEQCLGWGDCDKGSSAYQYMLQYLNRDNMEGLADGE